MIEVEKLTTYHIDEQTKTKAHFVMPFLELATFTTISRHYGNAR